MFNAYQVAIDDRPTESPGVNIVHRPLSHGRLYSQGLAEGYFCESYGTTRQHQEEPLQRDPSTNIQEETDFRSR
jgi:hypothetical protein